MGKVYRIAKWAETFETSDSRRHKSLSWVSLPILAGNGYNDLVETFGDEAPAVYGAWCSMLRVAAQAPVRGTLANSKGAPYSLGRIAAETRFPVAVFEKLFAWASSEDVGWLEFGEQTTGNQPSTGQQPAVNQPSTGLPNRTEQDLTQHNPTDRTNRTEADSGGRADGREVELSEPDGDRIVVGPGRWRESQPTREKIARVVSGDPGITPQKLRKPDLELCIKAAAVAHWGDMPTDWLTEVLKSMQARKTPLDNRWAFFRGSLIKAAERAGKNYHDTEARVFIPAARVPVEACKS